MSHFVCGNTTLDRLPMALSGITHVVCLFAGGVCPKLNTVSKQSESSLPQ